MQDSLRKIISRVDAVHAENDYEKEQQQVFQDVGERTMWSIQALNCVMVAAIVLTAFFQAIHLKHFFKTRKLI